MKDLIVATVVGGGFGFLCRVMLLPLPAPASWIGVFTISALCVGYQLGGIFK
jgi:XapX domain-containing protein